MAKEAKKLDELFHDTLKDIYYAEKKILSALPKMAKAAQNDDLRAAFEKHKTETEGQIDRLEQVFELIEESAYLLIALGIVGGFWLVAFIVGRINRLRTSRRINRGIESYLRKR